MPRIRVISALVLCAAFVVVVPASAQTPAMRAAFDTASLAWDAGHYPEALERLLALTTSSGTESLHSAIALLTGEWYRSASVTEDGTAPRWSADGRWFAWESGTGQSLRTHVASVDAGGTTQPVAEIAGFGLTFSPDGSRMAWLSVPDLPELRAARAELAQLGGQAAARRRMEIAAMERENARIHVRESAAGSENEIERAGVAPSFLVFGTDGELYAAGSTGTQAAIAITRLTGAAAPATTALAAGSSPISLIRPLAGTRFLAGLGREAFAVIDPATDRQRRYEGTAPAVSADGRYIVFLATAESETAIHLLDTTTDADPRLVKRSALPLASPAVSPDGSRIAFQMMPREDWEIYVIASDGSGEFRVTREIQHDLQPHFLAQDTLLGLIGEGRHRRSYVYDLSAAAQPEGTAAALAGEARGGTPGRIRLHHNNLVRTVAPEYEWAPSPDGRRVLIVADRDGNTITPERAITLLDRTAHVSADALAARIRSNLEAERRLRTEGERIYDAMRTAVADVVADVSTGRIYGYANDLFQFDSKFVTQPGNQKAIAYIEAQLRSFGYEPELQWFEARGVRTANIIARLPGTTDPNLVYVVSSHFDSVERGPGADDDSSGTTALLEAARVLADHPQAATIEFAFFTGEEAGLLGSREYVRLAVASGKQIVGALNNDMIGYANDHRLDNTIRYSNAGIRDIQHAAAFLFTDLITYDAKYYRSTDAAAYYEAYGDIVGGIGSYPILGNPHYHQSHDVLETINQQLVAEVSKTTVATLMLLASSPSRLTGVGVARTGDATEVIWDPAVESDVREYIVAWGAPGEEPRQTTRVAEPRANLRGVRPTDVIRVKAVNARGAESWDWATPPER
jgi:hypothetical protein